MSNYAATALSVRVVRRKEMCSTVE